LTPAAKLLINDTESLVDAIKTHIGICQLPDNLVSARVKAAIAALDVLRKRSPGSR